MTYTLTPKALEAIRFAADNMGGQQPVAVMTVAKIAPQQPKPVAP